MSRVLAALADLLSALLLAVALCAALLVGVASPGCGPARFDYRLDPIPPALRRDLPGVNHSLTIMNAAAPLTIR